MKFAACLLLSLSLASCGLFRAKPEPVEEEKPSSRYIGQIASVHASQGFALIRRVPGITIEAGSIVISRSLDGSAANLRISGESLGQMIAADIQSGTPLVGDSVREPLIEKREIEAGTAESDPQVTDNQ